MMFRIISLATGSLWEADAAAPASNRDCLEGRGGREDEEEAAGDEETEAGKAAIEGGEPLGSTNCMAAAD